jgi:biopolymer transport protein ExbB/TolQ
VATATGVERQTALAAGIAQAMYTAAFGIAVAVPLLFFHHILARRMETIVLEVEGGATSLLVALLGERKTDAAAAAVPLREHGETVESGASIIT